MSANHLDPARLYVDAGDPRRRDRARADLAQGFAQWRLAFALARLDLRNRYRGSVLGPFWLTLTAGIMVGALGVLYGTLFRLDIVRYIPHLAVSLIVWQWFAAVLNDACISLTSAEGVIRQLRLPYTVHALRCVFRHALSAAHSIPLILLVFLIMGHWPGAEALLVIPGLVLIIANMFAAALFLGMLCARFRDVGPIVGNAVQLGFFVTPVLWKPELLGHWQVFMPLNPFYALLETIRGPLIEGGGPWLAWVAAVLFTAAHLAVAAWFFQRFRARIAFWV